MLLRLLGMARRFPRTCSSANATGNRSIGGGGPAAARPVQLRLQQPLGLLQLGKLLLQWRLRLRLLLLAAWIARGRVGPRRRRRRRRSPWRWRCCAGPSPAGRGRRLLPRVHLMLACGLEEVPPVNATTNNSNCSALLQHVLCLLSAAAYPGAVCALAAGVCRSLQAVGELQVAEYVYLHVRTLHVVGL